MAPLCMPCADQEIVLGAGDDVDDGVADAEHVVAGGGHAGTSVQCARAL